MITGSVVPISKVYFVETVIDTPLKPLSTNSCMDKHTATYKNTEEGSVLLCGDI